MSGAVVEEEEEEGCSCIDVKYLKLKSKTDSKVDKTCSCRALDLLIYGYEAEPEATTTTARTTTTPAQTTPSRIGNIDGCPYRQRAVHYKDKCFWPYLPGKKISFDTGEVACKKQSGLPANLYDEIHYDRILKMIRSLMKKGEKDVGLFTGMTYTRFNNILKYDDVEGDFWMWRLWDPKYGLPRISLEVVKDPLVLGTGMATAGLDYTKNGILCEAIISGP